MALGCVKGAHSLQQKATSPMSNEYKIDSRHRFRSIFSTHKQRDPTAERNAIYAKGLKHKRTFVF